MQQFVLKAISMELQNFLLFICLVLVNPVLLSTLRNFEISITSGPELIRKNGFNLEQHNITTSDGYILSLYRIPFGRTSFNWGQKRIPTLLHHGFIADGFQWILNSVDKSLGYRLSESGYDVWLMNNRGTAHSLGHLNLTWRSQSYWNFSFHEIALYDTPAVINYILNTTGQEQLHYIGHSQGASAFFASMSLLPQYNSKIRSFIGLAPAVYVGNTTAPFMESARPILLNQQELHDEFLQGPFVHPDLIPLMQVAGELCSPQLISRWLCFGILEYIFGYNFVDNVYDLRREIAALGLSSTSLKSLFHLMQLWKSGKFQQYDYLEKNMQVYGQANPPLYKLRLVTAKVTIFCGAEDYLASCKDALRLTKILPNVKEFIKIDEPNFNHIDFLYSTNINSLLNDKIIQVLEQS